MVIFVRKNKPVQEEEYGQINISNVFANKESFGMGHSVKFNQDVVVVKNGIIDCNNVNVKGDLIGMVALVFNV